MLMMNARGRSWQALIGMLLCGLPAAASAEDPRRSVRQAAEEVGQLSGQQPLGAPQVLEIPPTQEMTPPSDPPAVVQHPSSMGAPQDESLRSSPDQPTAAARRSYLGLLYVSTDDGENGVMVLDVIPGSPAARAGFVGEKTP